MRINRRQSPGIGRLDKRVKIQSPGKVPDGGGGHTISYTTLCEIWAGIVDYGNRSGVEANHTESKLNAQWIIRYNPIFADRSEKDLRLVYKKRRYKITDIKDVNMMNVEMLLTVDGSNWEPVAD